MSELTIREWCASRGIDSKTQKHLSNQLRSQYCWIGQALDGQPVPSQLLEQEIIQLVCDTQSGRFPVRTNSSKKVMTSV